MKKEALNKKILIVEDEASLLKLLAESLRGEGFTVFTAENGNEGLGIAMAETPDLILLDLILPKMDGMTMLKEVRQQPWGKDIPVIILTNLSEEKIVYETLKEGAYDFIVKADWKLEDIINRIETKLGIK